MIFIKMSQLSRPVGRLGLPQRLCSVLWGIRTVPGGFRMTCNQIPWHPTTEGRCWWHASSAKAFPDTYRGVLQWSTPSESNSDLWPASGSSQTLCTHTCHCLWWWWKWSQAGRWPSPFSPALHFWGYRVPHRKHPASRCHPAPCQPQTPAVSGFVGHATRPQSGDSQLHLPCREGLTPLLPTLLAACSW